MLIWALEDIAASLIKAFSRYLNYPWSMEAKIIFLDIITVIIIEKL